MRTKSMLQVKTLRRAKVPNNQEIKVSSLLKSENPLTHKKVFVRALLASHTNFEEPNELLNYKKALLCVIINLNSHKSHKYPSKSAKR